MQVQELSRQPRTPMMRQYAKAKAEYPDAILLFRLGDFFEMFYDDAQVGARLLELVLTSREAGKGNRIPMCGVPVHAVESYTRRLLEAGLKVAICDQVEDAKLARGLVRREVVRVLTPGTVVEESMLQERRNNYLVAICDVTEAFGFAALDVSTGEFKATMMSGNDALNTLQAELVRLQPAECLLTSRLLDQACWERLNRSLSLHCTPWDASKFELTGARDRLAAHFGTAKLSADLAPAALCAAGAILDYLRSTHKAASLHITGLESYRLSQYMLLDATTRRNLELVQTMHKGHRKGSLLSELDHTITSMGGRLLRQWVEQPLMNVDCITERQDAIAGLVQDADMRHQLRMQLHHMYDIERLLARIAYGTATARQLVALRVSLNCLPQLREILAHAESSLLSQLKLACIDEARLAQLLEQTIVEHPPGTLKEGGYIRPGYHQPLDELMQQTERHEQWLERLQSRERQHTGIKSLKVRYNQVFGYYIEVSNANLKHVPARYRRKQTLTNGERFITDELKKREIAILRASERRSALEYELFSQIRGKIVNSARALQHIARAVAQLDALAALAEVAVLNAYRRPKIVTDGDLQIEQGRHPVVEQGINDFVPNDVKFDEETHRLLIITGPNMAGKSTYLRQVALITILAQIGSFVPAQHARIGLVDRIFTRVGAVDDITAGHSTFMVEMCETAHILHHATARSLLILDEIGKGTSTFEGLSIAWSVALFIARRLGSRALFATHYHELTALETLTKGVKNFHMAVRETPEDIIFLRQLSPGGCGKSYGLHVAQLAGLPAEVIHEAKSVLSHLERADAEPLPVLASSESQLELDNNSWAEQLLALDICQITPLKALTVLHQMQQQVRSAVPNGGVLTT